MKNIGEQVSHTATVSISNRKQNKKTTAHQIRCKNQNVKHPKSYLTDCMLNKMNTKPVEFNWIDTTEMQQEICNLPWELSLYRSLQMTNYKPCLTEDQYKAKTLDMEAYIFGFLSPLSPDYKECPGLFK